MTSPITIKNTFTTHHAILCMILRVQKYLVVWSLLFFFDNLLISFWYKFVNNTNQWSQTVSLLLSLFLSGEPNAHQTHISISVVAWFDTVSCSTSMRTVSFTVFWIDWLISWCCCWIQLFICSRNKDFWNLKKNFNLLLKQLVIDKETHTLPHKFKCSTNVINYNRGSQIRLLVVLL